LGSSRDIGLLKNPIVVDSQQGLNPEQIAAEYEVDVNRIREAQAFYNAHRTEINASIRAEQEVEGKRG
jgi:uncharacterized protein (DUF433 family)